MFKSYLKYSDEDRAWMGRARGAPASYAAPDYKRVPEVAPELALAGEAWVPPKGTELSEGAVNSMTEAAQFAFRANSSTRGALPKGWGKPPAKAKRVNAKDARIAELEARVRLLESELACAEELMAA